MLLVDRKKGNAVSPKAGDGLDGKCLAPYDAKTLARMGEKQNLEFHLLVIFLIFVIVV
ncbi:predicted protein [Sclerotinia sclerotiorum 1980 UF-70]|uniref:Uncharacterized protein n=1 Tax=Sclerotinia sclerotiorum (strain ATCC 18683 / 1980 / Ss-1) TaxID=665079 RepID=A7EU77_SCLS1|nr:predicted protein [Sclerotinia sclerotiorum 1980 UF-70]EDN93019.1 predicted protein [Sclerotinia sclerotiorum 1980 UF-70]